MLEVLRIMHRLTRIGVKITLLPMSENMANSPLLTVRLEFTRNGNPYTYQMCFTENDLYGEMPLVEFKKAEQSIKYGEYP